MVRRALSLRRGSALELEIETAVNSIGASMHSSIAPVRRSSRRESLPLSRHHQLRRSSSVSTRTRTNSTSTSSLSSLGDSDTNCARESTLDDELAVIIDDDELDSGAAFTLGRRKVYGDNKGSRLEKTNEGKSTQDGCGGQQSEGDKGEI